MDELKKRFGGSSLFGNEKDQSFKGSISAIDQTFDGIELYRSLEEKAAHLLYFVVKTIHFQMETRELQRGYSFGIWKRTKVCIFQMVLKESVKAHWSL